MCWKKRSGGVTKLMTPPMTMPRVALNQSSARVRSHASARLLPNCIPKLPGSVTSGQLNSGADRIPVELFKRFFRASRRRYRDPRRRQGLRCAAAAAAGWRNRTSARYFCIACLARLFLTYLMPVLVVKLLTFRNRRRPA
ncbi:hypothetical protein CALVIDRAFT_228379 [Calocera viscosa TUFC12733]|uniref:Uncharacterized protein n=1 Tax=Calocera viscosa (strain TUFC12733) TaxID=1330018 RepID=A0A167K433_CALVF|nr:hypothetical protein CALVIDRAFT_228379 [Calocera viscosa TUFC12733]